MKKASTSTFRIDRGQFRSLRVKFVEDMDNIASFMDHAMTGNLLRKEHYNEIMSTTNVYNQIRKMLDFVEKKLPARSDDFLDALIKSGNEYLAQQLLPPGTSLADLQKAFNMEITPTQEVQKETNKYQIEHFSKFRVHFIEYMSDLPTFIDFALQINLLDRQHGHEIMSDPNVDQQVRKMCDIMDRKLPQQSDKFLYALNESGNDYLVSILLSKPGDIFDFSDEFSRLKTGEGNTATTDTTTTPRQEVGGGAPGYHRDTSCYPMKKRGRVLIIENLKFDNHNYNRYGSEKDRDGLKTLFEKLHFQVIIRQNLNAEEMEQELRDQIREEKGRDEDCFIVFILSHGRESVIYGVDFSPMHYSAIYKEFNKSPIWNDPANPKPKLIYIQACQPSDEEPDAPKMSAMPPGGHYYVLYATIPGEFALRTAGVGSRLIQSLLEVYQENYLTEDVETMGTKIRTMLYRSRESGNNSFQIASNYVCLTQRVYLS